MNSEWKELKRERWWFLGWRPGSVSQIELMRAGGELGGRAAAGSRQ